MEEQHHDFWNTGCEIEARALELTSEDNNRGVFLFPVRNLPFSLYSSAIETATTIQRLVLFFDREPRQATKYTMTWRCATYELTGKDFHICPKRGMAFELQN